MFYCFNPDIFVLWYDLPFSFCVRIHYKLSIENLIDDIVWGY
jgi:hypothetical protein